METLFCETGKHKWERPVVRGRKPRNCPDHKSSTPAPAPAPAPAPTPAPAPAPPEPVRKEEILVKAREVKAAKRSRVEDAIAIVVKRMLNDPRLGKEEALKLAYVQAELQKQRDPKDQDTLRTVRTTLVRDYYRRIRQPIPSDIGIKSYWT